MPAYIGLPEWQRESRPGKPELENVRMLNTEPRIASYIGIARGETI